MYNGKYIKLNRLLTQKSNEVTRCTLRFDEIEELLQFKLPSSAYKYSAWWANEIDGNHSHARSWLFAGWKTSNVKLGDKVTFIKHR